MPVFVLGPEGEPGIEAQAYACGARSYLVRPRAECETLELLQVVLDDRLRISRIPD